MTQLKPPPENPGRFTCRFIGDIQRQTNSIDLVGQFDRSIDICGNNSCSRSRKRSSRCCSKPPPRSGDKRDSSFKIQHYSIATFICSENYH